MRQATERDRSRATQILADADLRGHAHVAAELLPLVYDELRALARRYLKRERRDHTLQPTALVHEAFLRLVDQSRVNWAGRAHFYAVCAEAMRRILIDYARNRRRIKRGGGWQKILLDDAVAPLGDGGEIDLVNLNEALDKLRELDPRQARIVELRFLGGMTVEEVASVLSLSKRTIEGDWTHAKAWLRKELARDQE